MRISKPQELQLKGITQLENDSQVNGDMEKVSRFTLKNIE